MMKYFIAENGQQAGPFDSNELLQHGLTLNSLVWCEGMPTWVSASQVPELMALLNGQPFNPGGFNTQLPQNPPMGEVQLPQVPPFGGQQQQPTQPTTYGQGNQPYAPPQYGPNRPNQMSVKTWFTEALIVTILSALCCCNPVGLCTGIYSVFRAYNAKNKAAAGDSTGATNDATAAKKWMIVTVVIGVVWAGIQAYKVMTDPTFLQQIQQGAMGSLYGS